MYAPDLRTGHPARLRPSVAEAGIGLITNTAASAPYEDSQAQRE
jgi:hypothetical protein